MKTGLPICYETSAKNWLQSDWCINQWYWHTSTRKSCVRFVFTKEKCDNRSTGQSHCHLLRRVGSCCVYQHAIPLLRKNVFRQNWWSLIELSVKIELLQHISKEVGLEVRAKKSECTVECVPASWQGQLINAAQYEYVGTTVTSWNCIDDEIQIRLNSGNACSIQFRIIYLSTVGL